MHLFILTSFMGGVRKGCSKTKQAFFLFASQCCWPVLQCKRGMPFSLMLVNVIGQQHSIFHPSPHSCSLFTAAFQCVLSQSKIQFFWLVTSYRYVTNSYNGLLLQIGTPKIHFKFQPSVIPSRLKSPNRLMPNLCMVVCKCHIPKWQIYTLTICCVPCISAVTTMYKSSLSEGTDLHTYIDNLLVISLTW